MKKNDHNDQKVAVIIPAYNEGTVIKDVIQEIHSALQKSSINYLIILVDDKSSDNTAEIAEKEDAYVIRHLINTGSGGATITGLRYACDNGFQIAATIDGDGQHNPYDLAKGILKIQQEGGDLLIGNRLANPDGMPVIKQIGNSLLSSITFAVFGVKVTDSQSGLRFFSRKSIQSLKWHSTGYEFCSEMLWRAKQNNLKIAEFPIQAIYTKYSISKGQRTWNAVNIVKTLFKHRIMDIFYE